MAFKDRTKEETAELLAKAYAAKVAKAIFRQENKHNIKTDYLDNGYWGDLASKYKIRMPSTLDAVSTTILRKYLKRCGVSVEVFNEHYTSMAYFVKRNPKWNAYAAAGLILELRQMQENNACKAV